MEFVTGIVILIVIPLALWARQQVDAAAPARRRAEADSGVDVIIDPASCHGGDADGGSGCGGGCGGCGG